MKNDNAISPIIKYGTLKPFVEYEIIEEGYDYYLLKNGYYLPNLFAGKVQPLENEEEEYAGAI